MLFVSTKGVAPPVTFLNAVTEGLAPDGGLYVPSSYPKLPAEFFETIYGRSLHELALEVLYPYVEGALSRAELSEIVEQAFTFDAPLVQLEEGLYSLELFHGPTLAFKDFGVRFMAQLMARRTARPTTILTATSGDTGAAVASAFHKAAAFRVIVLYPKAKVTRFQEQQIASLGDNVTALEVKGSFDDCQRLVKQAFTDSEVRARIALCSANSINLARLLPQIAYYYRACAQLDAQHDIICSVPSGNFGDIAAGLIAREMGLKIKHFTAATNVNDVVPRFLAGGAYEPRAVVETISNAMDIAAPSNFERIFALFENNPDRIRRSVLGSAWSDRQTLDAMKELYDKFSYIADPHGAVAYLGLKKALEHSGGVGIFLETAHPAKFHETVSEALRVAYSLPRKYHELMRREKLSIEIKPSYQELRGILMEGA